MNATPSVFSRNASLEIFRFAAVVFRAAADCAACVLQSTEQSTNAEQHTARHPQPTPHTFFRGFHGRKALSGRATIRKLELSSYRLSRLPKPPSTVFVAWERWLSAGSGEALFLLGWVEKADEEVRERFVPFIRKVSNQRTNANSGSACACADCNCCALALARASCSALNCFSSGAKYSPPRVSPANCAAIIHA